MTTSTIELKQESQWQKTPVANLVRNTASGIYYARVRIKGKLIWKSLKADTLSVAKLRLGDFLKQENKRVEITEAAERGRMTFGDALAIFKKRLEEAHHLKPRANPCHSDDSRYAPVVGTYPCRKAERAVGEKSGCRCA